MSTTKNNLAIKSKSSTLPTNSLSLAINFNKKGGYYRSYFLTLLSKIFTISIFGALLFTACKKDDDVKPLASNSYSNDIYLKAGAPTFYISPNGSDAANGDITHPWKTLAYACNQVTTPGNIIYVNAGSYTETKQCNLAVGVSITGEAEATTILNFTYQAAGEGIGCIHLASTSEGTFGNQSISELTLDGGLTAYYAMAIRGRSNVKLHDITVRNFLKQGITFGGRTDYADAAPNTYATGNEVYNCSITNSATFIGGGGNLQIGGQSGMLVYSNTINQTGRATGSNGYCIKFYNSGYNKGLKIYSNTFTKAPYDGTTFDFALELWHESGLEIYNNTIVGSIDINFLTKGAYSYSTYIHDNTIGPASVQTQEERGIYIEFGADAVVIANNTLKNLAIPISFIPRSGNLLNDITIRNNVCSNIGMSGSQWGYAILFSGASGITNFSVSNLFVYNNAFINNPASNTYWGVNIPVCSSATNIKVINNIIENFDAGAIVASNATNINGLNISNNIIFGNGNNNNPKFTTGTPSNYTTTNNLQIDPLFVSTTDLHLRSGSPGIDKGINVSLPYNGTAPDMGAFEFATGESTNTTVTNQPPLIQNQTFQLNEKSSNGTSAGIIAASDPNTGQTLTYSILSGNTSGAFAINTSTGALSIANSAALNYLTTPSYSLVVKVEDNGTSPLSTQATITINITSTSVNSAPVIKSQSFNISRSVANGTVVGTVTASDPNAGQVLKYVITSGNNNNTFIINSTTGKITVNKKWAFNYSRVFQLTVKVNDNGAPSLSNQATITINTY